MENAPPAPAKPSTSTLSEWHTIRPWTPHLALAVREITSVSATFILSSSLDARPTTDAELGPGLSVCTPEDASHDAAITDSRGIIADAMCHGLSVDVNGSNWQRVILRMNDHADEAIIVIYGLHPGRQYDIDLALVSGGTMRKQVVTEEAESSALDGERSEDPNAIPTPETITLAPSTSTINESSPTPTPSPTPSPEDRLRTLSNQLNALHSEQATIQAVLKSSRRDANKSSTALRTDIEVLKRASEKAAIAEGKARQRVRTLEDAVRRAHEVRAELEKATEQDEQELPALKEKQLEAEEVLKKVKTEADEVRAKREKREEEARKRKESMKGECATLNQKLERLGAKKDKLENTVISDLAAQLAEIEREIEATERSGFQSSESWDAAYGDPVKEEMQRRRQSHPGTIGRPILASVQRPGLVQTQLSSPSVFSRHQPRSQSAYRVGTDVGLPHPPGLAHPPGVMHTPTSSMSPSASVFAHSSNPVFSQSTPPLSRSTSSVTSSTLSSKAAPFEPTRSFTFSSSSSSGAFPSGGPFSMSGQGTFSQSAGSTTFPHTGPNSGGFIPSSTTSPFTLSGTYPPIQRPAHATHTSTGSSLGGAQLRPGRPPVSRELTGEAWAVPDR
ncbi:hypothetical protein PAXRUDRAFT_826902 [Paxillus rubicundulus Ve08.2h10]|uniref:Uncharacterized protein n=1 Tax=Paxillus rubicundulus Ve08.2h10 TaxID=930991 RepID=A0A0D0E3P7_9AGAM|nr:hypothetical protein PAXRUDRAFT_826902 [Paxillus rubicundulus Ve08.2h10]